MKDRLLAYLRYIPQLVGIEAFFDEEGYRLHAVLLRRKGNQIEVLQRFGEIEDIDALLKAVPKEIPMVFALNGKGIIHRFVAAKDSKEDSDLVKLVLPNARKQDFYVQHYALPVCAVVSLIRKDRLAELISHFDILKQRILALSLGPFAISPLLPLLVSEDDDQYAVYRHQFQLQKNEPVAYQLMEGTDLNRVIKIGTEELHERFAVAFSLAFAIMSEIPAPILPVEELAGRLEEQQQQNQFKRSAMLVGIGFLVLLLLNTFYFLHYNALVQQISTSDTQMMEKEIIQLKSVLQGQEELVEVIQYARRTDGEPLSYIADKIGESVPNAILLQELSFFPKDEAASRRERKPIYQAGQVQIKGTSTTIRALNDWVKVLGLMDYFQKVQLVSYQFDEKEERGVFLLKIGLR